MDEDSTEFPTAPDIDADEDARKMSSNMMIVYWVLGVVGIALTILLVSNIWYRITSRRSRCKKLIRMDGKTVIVTGANSGIGKETALELARLGAQVIMGCRDVQQREAEARDDIINKSGNKDVHVFPLDLASLDSVRNFVELVKQHTDKLDVLVNNAGAYGVPNRKSKDGLLEGMQVNYFGPFFLTLQLLDLLKSSAPSRILVVSSVMHRLARLQMDDLNCEKLWLGDTMLYNNSKLANILFSNELARRLRDTGVTCNSLHPGIVRTNIVRKESALLRGFINFFFGLALKDAQSGAQTTVYLAVAEEVQNVTGKYFVDCKEAKTTSTAQDETLALSLWNESLRLLHLGPDSV